MFTISDKITGYLRPHKRLLVPLILIILAVLIRLTAITIPYPWGDELFGFYCIKSPFFRDITRIEAAFNPHGYYLLMRFLDFLSPLTVLDMRLVSAFFSALTLWPLLLIARRHLSFAATLMLLLLWAVSPLQLFFAQEARAYSLVTLLGCFMLYFLLEMVHRPRPGALAGFVATATLALYTHYMTLFFLPVTLLFPLFLGSRRALKDYFIAALAIAILFLPYFYLFNIAAAKEFDGHAWIMKPTSYLAEFLRSFIKLIIDFPLSAWHKHLYGHNYPAAVRIANWLMGSALLLGLLALVVRRQTPAVIRLFVVSYLALIAVLVGITAGYRPYFVAGRYETLAQPLLLLALAYGWGELSKKSALFSMGLAALLVGFCAFKIGLYWQAGTEHHQKIKADLDHFMSQIKENDLVLLERGVRLDYLMRERGYTSSCTADSCSLSRPSGPNFEYVDMPIRQELIYFKFEPPFYTRIDPERHQRLLKEILRHKRPRQIWLHGELRATLKEQLAASHYCLQGDRHARFSFSDYLSFTPCAASPDTPLESKL
jgi:hypothetical protein